MKKVIIVALALFLAIPAISYAGSVTSRWDVVIGGYVKFDMGWNDKGVGADFMLAPRKSAGGNENILNEYGNFFTAAGETTLNFLIKGPDGWGAKTTAFIEGDFEAKWVNGGNANDQDYGLFSLRHAWMKFSWANTSLLIGQAWQVWGLVPTYGGRLLGNDFLAPFMKGARQPQIALSHRFDKNWAGVIAIAADTSNLGSGGGASKVNSFTRSSMPFGEGELTWTSDACGKIGPWQMLFGLGGFFGREKQTYNIGAPAAQAWRDKDVNAWSVLFKGFIPVIPEKKGNKTGALSISGAVFTGQNMSWFGAGPSGPAWGSYARADMDYVAPTGSGGWGHIAYFFADNVHVNGYYGYARMNYSNNYQMKAGTPATLADMKWNNIQHIIVNLMYDVNPAVRLGLEWANINTNYPSWTDSKGALYERKGSVNSFRIGAFYFF